MNGPFALPFLIVLALMSCLIARQRMHGGTCPGDSPGSFR